MHNRILKRCFIYLSLPLVALFLLTCSTQREDRPNIILIVVDSLRADHLGCYGYARDTSPNIDRLAREGTLFTTAIAPTSWTLPSITSILTSLEISTHGVGTHKTRLGDSVQTLAQALKQDGYATAGFISGTYLHPIYGFDRGFDVYENLIANPFEAADKEQRVTSAVLSGIKESLDDITSPAITERVTKWLDGNRKKPFFLFIHYWDVHYDYIPPPPYDTMFDPDYAGTIDARNFFFNEAINPDMSQEDLTHIIALYDGEIRFTDEHIGKLLDTLEQKGLDKNTLIVVTADHGDEFFEHGRKGHQQTLYDEVLNVPLIFTWDGRIPANKKVTSIVGIIDIMPTILDLAGIGTAPEMMGQSLRSGLLGDGSGSTRQILGELYIFWDEKGHLYSLRTDTGKIIYDFGYSKEFLYDLQQDPAEQDNIANATSITPLQAEMESRLLGTIQDAKRKKEEWKIREEPLNEMSEAQKEHLRSLGYLK